MKKKYLGIALMTLLVMFGASVAAYLFLAQPFAVKDAPLSADICFADIEAAYDADRPLQVTRRALLDRVEASGELRLFVPGQSKFAGIIWVNMPLRVKAFYALNKKEDNAIWVDLAGEMEVYVRLYQMNPATDTCLEFTSSEILDIRVGPAHSYPAGVLQTK